MLSRAAISVYFNSSKRQSTKISRHFSGSFCIALLILSVNSASSIQSEIWFFSSGSSVERYFDSAFTMLQYVDAQHSVPIGKDTIEETQPVVFSRLIHISTNTCWTTDRDRSKIVQKFIGKETQTRIIQIENLVKGIFAAIFYVLKGNQIFRLCHGCKNNNNFLS